MNRRRPDLESEMRATWPVSIGFKTESGRVLTHVLEPEEVVRFFDERSILVRKWKERISNTDENHWCIVAKDREKSVATVHSDFLEGDFDPGEKNKEKEEEGIHAIEVDGSFVGEETVEIFLEFLREGTDKRISKKMTIHQKVEFLKFADYVDVLIDNGGTTK